MALTPRESVWPSTRTCAPGLVRTSTARSTRNEIASGRSTAESVSKSTSDGKRTMTTPPGDGSSVRAGKVTTGSSARLAAGREGAASGGSDEQPLAEPSSATVNRFCGRPICHELPLVAPARLH